MTEVCEEHAKEKEEQFKVSHLGIDKRSNVTPTHDKDIVLSDSRQLSVNVMDQDKGGGDRDPCYDDPLAINARLSLCMGLSLHNDRELVTGDPVISCEVGHHVGWDSDKGLVQETISGIGLTVSDEIPCVSRVVSTGSAGPLKRQEGGWAISTTKLESLNFKDDSATPAVAPPDGFKCHFLEGVWALVPISVISNARDYTEVNDVGIIGEDVEDGSDVRSPEVRSQDIGHDSDDSMTEFERNLKILLPCLHEETESLS